MENQKIFFINYYFLLLNPFLPKALFASGILSAPSPHPDKPQSAAGDYGSPAQPSCTLQRVEQPSGYGCQQDQECSTSYQQECSTSYEQQCENVYEEKCETKERLQRIKYIMEARPPITTGWLLLENFLGFKQFRR